MSSLDITHSVYAPDEPFAVNIDGYSEITVEAVTVHGGDFGLFTQTGKSLSMKSAGSIMGDTGVFIQRDEGVEFLNEGSIATSKGSNGTALDINAREFHVIKEGSMTGANGLRIQFDQSSQNGTRSVENTGEIGDSGTETALSLSFGGSGSRDVDIVNSGTITGRHAIEAVDTDIFVTNSGTINGSVSAFSGSWAFIENSGHIHGAITTIRALEIYNDGLVIGTITSLNNRGDEIDNSGQILGDIHLGGGRDEIDNDGILEGNIVKGSGDLNFSNTDHFAGDMMVSGALDMRNWGVIDGDIATGAHDDKIKNSGDIYGNVDLGIGDNEFDGFFGTVSGEITSGSGNDTIEAGSSDDIVWAGAGNDIVIARSGANALFGEDGQDTLLGGSDHDELQGGEGDDVLIGDNGADTLIGGDGADTFVYHGLRHSTEQETDTIMDFRLGDDVIDLSAILTANQVKILNYSSGSFVKADLSSLGLPDF